MRVTLAFPVVFLFAVTVATGQDLLAADEIQKCSERVRYEDAHDHDHDHDDHHRHPGGIGTGNGGHRQHQPAGVETLPPESLLEGDA